MLAEVRHREILSRLEAKGAVRVVQLAGEMGVTEETIRRDLAKLHEHGQLVRTHGGAVLLDSRRYEIPFEIRQTEMLEEKEAIAAAAVGFIEEGSVVGLDASTTVLELARLIPDCPLTVVTSSLMVARALADRTKITVTLTGGDFDPTSWSLTGAIALSTLQRFNITHAFISCRGVDPERGLSEASEPMAQFKQALLEGAERTYLLADHSKIGLRSTMFIGRINQLAAIITDDQCDADAIERFSHSETSIIKAKIGARPKDTDSD